MKAVHEKSVTKYLKQMISSYLDNRRLQIEKGDEDTTEMEVSCGVPQGSVLGPTL